MALHGSASSNLSPILFKGNNRSLAVNVIIHQDQSASMVNLIQFYSDGSFIGGLQEALIAEKIGDDLEKYPNLYSYFDLNGRNSSTPFTISNLNGSLTVTQSFMRGELTRNGTINKWIGSNYFSNNNLHTVNICTNVTGTTTGGRLVTSSLDQNSEDVHGNLWSIFTSPNAISTGIPGRYGSIIDSEVRRGTETIIITNSDEQDNSGADMINQLVDVSGGSTVTSTIRGRRGLVNTTTTSATSRSINGPAGEMVFRGYRVIALSSYTSTDGYDGVLFYGPTSAQPYGYVKFLTSSNIVETTGNATSNVTTISVGSTAGIVVGMDVRGTGIAANTTVSNIGLGTVTLSSATIAIVSGTITFLPYRVIRSSVAPNWSRTTTKFDNITSQRHDTLTLASETRGGLFKIFNVFNTTASSVDYRIAFSKCLAEFIADTV